MRLPFRSFTVLICESSGTPAHGVQTPFGVAQLRDLDHVRVLLQDPVLAREADVEDAVVHVPSHLLGADHDAFDVRIVDGRVVAP
jgi:hypothetical protein